MAGSSISQILTSSFMDHDGVDVEEAVNGLCDVIKQRFYEKPHNSAIEAFKLLFTHLNIHYETYNKIEKLKWPSEVRKKIMQLLLNIRVNSSGQVGLVNDSNEIVFSSYYTFKSNSNSHVDSPNSSGVATNNTSPSQTPMPFATRVVKVINCPLPLNELFPIIIIALEKEKDWNVLSTILEKLPSFLTSEVLIHQTPSANIGKFTHILCYMIEEATYYSTINYLHTQNTERFSKTAFQSYIFPILSNLVSYHKLIDSNNQAVLVKSLNVGLQNVMSKHQCITSLALCVVEMQDIMIKALPKLLLDLSKISQTVQIANPLLEFLSYATLDPRLYASFVPDQYLNIFAIVLPFTNPTKFSEYIVTQAFRVMSMWFLKCRISFRKLFINYIMKNIKVHVIKPMINSSQQSEEIRKRSGSFNSETTTKSDSQSNLNNSNSNVSSAGSAALFHPNKEFFMELVESHMDLLARYTQGLCSTVPETPSKQEMLLDRSQSSTWIIGQRLLTITTSGCKSRIFVDGLCERCYRLCKSVSATDPSSDDVFNSITSDINNLINCENNFSYNNTEQLNCLQHSNSASNTTSNNFSANDRNPISSRRRHQSAFTPNNSSKPASRAYDDSHLNFTNSTYSSSDDYEESTTCSCWCEGWAEICIRRPSGSCCWKMRIQNRLNVPCYPYNPFDMFTSDLTRLFPLRSFKSETDADSGVVRGEDPLAADSSDLNVSPPVFRRTSSSPDIDGAENTVGLSPTDRKAINSNDSLEGSANDLNSVKISRASSLGRGDSVKQSQFTRSSSFSWKSPSRYKNSDTCSVNYEILAKDVIPSGSTPNSTTSDESMRIKRELQLDLNFEPVEQNNCSNSNKSGEEQNNSLKQTGSSSPSSSGPALPSSLTANSRTPPKAPLKLEGISEVKSSENAAHVGHRGRLATISVMSPAVKPLGSVAFKRTTSNQRITEMSNPRNDGIKPSFVFLQFFYDASINDSASKEQPILLPKAENLKTSLNYLDRILPHEIHKIAILYVDTDQTKDISVILSNRHGSYRYTQFIRTVGNVISLRDTDPSRCYIGGLSQNGQDGKFAISWQDNLTQVIFHVATLMPNKENDPGHKNKMAHIGNDCVCIIYNNSGQSLDVNNLKCSKFLLAAVVIDPLDFERNSVSVQFFDEGLSEVVLRRESVVISDAALPSYVRQLSLNLNIGSLIYHSKKSITTGFQYAPNCVERLRQINRIRQKALQHKSEDLKRNPGSLSHAYNRSTSMNLETDDSVYCDKFIDDFTAYI